MFGIRRRLSADFKIEHQADPSTALLCGFSAYGLAGLTAVGYLVDHLKLEAYGYIRAEGLPSITPFEAGAPRHPIRLFYGPSRRSNVHVIGVCDRRQIAREYRKT